MKSFNYITGVCIVICLIAVSCKKNVIPIVQGGDGGAPVNFYNASDLLVQAYTDKYYFFVDKPLDITPNPKGSVSYFSNLQQDFPSYQDTYSSISYLSLSAASHHIIFTDGLRQSALDTTLALSSNTYSTMYIADQPKVTTAAYKVFVVPEERAASPGKVRVRFINLSPDADSLSCYRDKPGGSKGNDVLKGKLGFGSVTPYIELDTAQNVNSKINFHFFVNKDTANNVLLTRIDTKTGSNHSYVVVINGFQRSATRKVPNGKNTDGSIKYQTLSLAPNLRIKVRQSY